MADSAAGLDFGAREFPAGELGWAELREQDQAAPAGHVADRELALRLCQGEDAAYERLLARFQDPIHGLIYRLLHQPADTEDVTQEVFLKVFRCIGSFRGDSSLKTWMYRIAVNESRNHVRKCARRCGLEVGLEDEASDGLTWEQVIEDHHSSPFEAVATSEAHATIEAALAQVKPLFREAVVLRDVEQLSYQEIAVIVGENPATVKTRILRGRRALRALLAIGPGEVQDGERL